MKNNNKKNNIAVDIGKKKCVVCIMDDAGTILEETSYDNTTNDATSFAKDAISNYGKCRAVCESTGNMWIKTYEAFEKQGITVQLANPLKTRAIAEARIKTDKVDARTLAHLLRTDLVAQCYIAPAIMRDNRQLLRHRTSLVRDRTSVINRIHNLLDKYDISTENRGHDMHSQKSVTWLTNQHLVNQNDDSMLQQCARHIEYLNLEIRHIERDIARQASKNKYVPVLMSMTGIDYFVAMTLATEIGDIKRFATPAKLVSWSGMCPTIHQSGNMLYHGKMKKDSNRKVNWVMVQSANVAARYDDRMRSFYLRVRKRHGHTIAVTHVANKMLTIIWHMMSTDTLYTQRKEELYQKKLKKMNAQ